MSIPVAYFDAVVTALRDRGRACGVDDPITSAERGRLLNAWIMNWTPDQAAAHVLGERATMPSSGGDDEECA